MFSCQHRADHRITCVESPPTQPEIKGNWALSDRWQLTNRSFGSKRHTHQFLKIFSYILVHHELVKCMWAILQDNDR